MADYKPRVVEPGEVIVGVVGEMASLQVAVDRAHAEPHQRGSQGRVLAAQHRGIEEGSVQRQFKLGCELILSKSA